MQSKAKTVAEYLASLPADRRAAIAAVREVILANLDRGFEEGMQYGMIGFFVPHRVFPAGYHCDPKQPLSYAGLASQKDYMSLYLFSVYAGGDNGDAAWLRSAWEATGRKLDMGKGCIRFRSIDDVPLAVIAEAIRRVPLQKHIAVYTESLAARGKAPAAGAAKRGKAAKPAGRTAAAAKAPKGRAAKAGTAKAGTARRGARRPPRARAAR
jgi:hypothetical protein